MEETQVQEQNVEVNKIDIVEGPIGTVGKYDVEFKEGALVVEIDANVAIGTAGLVVKIDAGKVMDAIKNAIPGKVDDAIIDVIKAALLSK